MNLGFVFPPICISVKQDNFMFIITLCSKCVNMICFRNILLIRISMGANNCVQRVFENLPHFQLFKFNERLDFCDFS